ncbi:venom protease-like [Lutzomyia longipalpis]|uniref:venom protease-like n=1 Tax=Lutzomyia longipalpis TaxID=7200 RepID=UPI00248385A0|nr:venom protease-like [Lutzomyia longipalpis]XP_055696328.1 venom protease-like [Lutzomyia longipalpis]XP_055696329.1 venom protease-like [Lutzomyia longipalpis]
MSEKFIFFLILPTILSFPQDNIYFRDETIEIGSRCRAAEGFGTCVLDKNCRDNKGQYSINKRPIICFFHEMQSPVICCPNNLVVQEEKSSSPSWEDTFTRRPSAKPNQANQSDNLENPPQPPATFAPIVPAQAPVDAPAALTRISAKKCQEYSKNFTNEMYVEPPSVFHISVVGGVPANLGEFPHMAALGNPDPDGNGTKFFCGGSLISERYILTAAHCVGQTVPTVVRLGELDLTKDDDGATPRDYGIEQIFSHPDYKGSSVYSDIALIRLNETVEFYKLVRPACLPQNATEEGLGLAAYGWGHTSFGGTESPFLQKVTLSVFTKEECTPNYPPSRRLKDGLRENQICAGDYSGLKDTCQGDSGGPLSIYTYNEDAFANIYHILGVTSFGQGCGGATPAIYTRVFAYLDWIENIVWNS